jgi:hypothetical protein
MKVIGLLKDVTKEQSFVSSRDSAFKVKRWRGTNVDSSFKVFLIFL